MDKKFKFTTKMKPDHRWTSLDFCQEKIENHFKKFNGNEIQTLLFHDTDILFKKIGTKIFKNIETLKKKKYFKKIGLSIYDTECLNYLIPNYSFDVVQCPYNILDKRIINSGWFNKLKDKGIEIHVRSIFLQGLLVNKLVYKKKYFKKWRFFFIKWFQNLENNNISPIDYCLSDLLNHDFDQIIIGINNYDNLKEIINFKIVKNKKMLNFKKTELKLIDPRKWK
jgi:aryl-alcohol dehydrogenase-like predicted oxidoreductase